MHRFEFIKTQIEGLLLVRRKCIEDDRGFLSRLYCAEEFASAGVHKAILQINHTLTRRKGAVRGMHFQRPPYAETKFVSCLRGELLDVAVDLRKSSRTFLNWHAEILSAQNQCGMLIPEGFAHGFQTLTDDCEVVYLNTAAYRKAAEAALNPNDSRVAIKWPLEITDISDRDKSHPMLAEDFEGIVQ